MSKKIIIIITFVLIVVVGVGIRTYMEISSINSSEKDSDTDIKVEKDISVFTKHKAESKFIENEASHYNPNWESDTNTFRAYMIVLRVIKPEDTGYLRVLTHSNNVTFQGYIERQYEIIQDRIVGWREVGRADKNYRALIDVLESVNLDEFENRDSNNNNAWYEITFYEWEDYNKRKYVGSLGCNIPTSPGLYEIPVNDEQSPCQESMMKVVDVFMHANLLDLQQFEYQQNRVKEDPQSFDLFDIEDLSDKTLRL